MGFYEVKKFSMFDFALYFNNGNLLPVAAIFLILAGAAVLVFVDIVKNIKLTPKLTLSFVAKLLILASVALMLITVLSMPRSFIRVGTVLILVLITAIVFLFEEKNLTFILKRFIRLNKGAHRVIIIVGLAICIVSGILYPSTHLFSFIPIMEGFLGYTVSLIITIALYLFFIRLILWIVDGYKSNENTTQSEGMTTKD